MNVSLFDDRDEGHPGHLGHPVYVNYFKIKKCNIENTL